MSVAATVCETTILPASKFALEVVSSIGVICGVISIVGGLVVTLTEFPSLLLLASVVETVEEVLEALSLISDAATNSANSPVGTLAFLLTEEIGMDEATVKAEV